MESGHDFDAAKISKFPADATDAFALFQKISERRVSHHDNHLRLNRRDFAKQEWTTNRGLFESRLAITRWPTTIHVSDDHVLAPHSHGFDHLRQQLPGAANKGLALCIFVCARCFADEHQARISIPVSVYDLRPTFY